MDRRTSGKAKQANFEVGRDRGRLASRDMRKSCLRNGLIRTSLLASSTLDTPSKGARTYRFPLSCPLLFITSSDSHSPLRQNPTSHYSGWNKNLTRKPSAFHSAPPSGGATNELFLWKRCFLGIPAARKF